MTGFTPENDNTVTKWRLILLRHGQTDYTAQSRITGIADAKLTEAGIEQARAAGRLIRGIPVHKAYSSTLSRAFNTAQLALRTAGQSHLEEDDGTFRVSSSADIVEIDSGDFTGRCYKTDPEITNWKREFHKATPNGESYAMAMNRVQRFFDREVMPRIERGETVMVVCHAGIVRVFDYVLGLAEVPARGAQEELGKRSIHNAAPVVFDFVDGKLVAETVLAADGAHNRREIAPRQFKFG